MCWDDRDLADGKPTGAVRVSFGYSSTFEDAQVRGGRGSWAEVEVSGLGFKVEGLRCEVEVSTVYGLWFMVFWVFWLKV